MTEDSSSRTTTVPIWTPDLGTGLIVAGSLALAAAVVLGRGMQPAAAMLIALSAPCRLASLDLHVARPALLRHSGRPVRAGRAILDDDRASVRSGALPDRGGARTTRLVRISPRRSGGSASAYPARCSGGADRRAPRSAPSLVNVGRVAPLASAVLKGVTLFLSFIIFFYFVSSVVSTWRASSS